MSPLAAFALFVWTTTALSTLLVVVLMMPFAGLWQEAGARSVLLFVLMVGALLMPPVALGTTVLGFPLFSLLRRDEQPPQTQGAEADRRAAMMTLLIVLCGAILFGFARYGFGTWSGLPEVAGGLGGIVVLPVGWMVAKWIFPAASSEQETAQRSA